MKLRPEVKSAWLPALRSGDYPQAHGVLHQHGKGYCCLGVLATVLGVPATNQDVGAALFDFTGDGKTVIAIPPNEWATSLFDDLTPIESGEFRLTTPGNVLGYLAGRNDCEVPFPVIADWIEENL